MFEIRVISPMAEITLEVPDAGPGIMSDATLMRGAKVVAYVGGAIPPEDHRRTVVALLPPIPSVK